MTTYSPDGRYPPNNQPDPITLKRHALLQTAETMRWQIGQNFHEQLMEDIYTEAAQLADRAVTHPDEKPHFDLDGAIDRIVTSRTWGFPMMILLFTIIFWITIVGANVPSAWLATFFFEFLYPILKNASAAIGLPWWLDGVLLDGIYMATAWVISVMVPPMAIFFPMFTLLEDFGYLPRMAFNLDNIFKKSGAHGKQSLSMMMGFGCNAAGVVSTRIIDSPRERLIAIITNNFALCNGRWPTIILIATLFVGAAVPPFLAGFISAMTVVGIALLGVLMTFVVSWSLSRTILKGEVSTFSLELPPYRPPRILRTIYTSIIDRTLFVLWRAIIFALPAGAIIWISANIIINGVSLAEYAINFLTPLGILVGMNGVILLAYVFAIPANEIVIPTVLMLTALVLGSGGEGAGVMFEPDAEIIKTLFVASGWTLLTAVNLMLFSLIHNPCSTTIFTIFKETGSKKWTAVSAFLPLVMGFIITFFVAQIWRLFTG